MAAAVWKIPRAWRPSLVDVTALYPALCLRGAGHNVAIAETPTAGAWISADLRVLVLQGPLGEDERDLISAAAPRGLPTVLAAQTGLSEADRAFAASSG